MSGLDLLKAGGVHASSLPQAGASSQLGRALVEEARRGGLNGRARRSKFRAWSG
jgi:hypothetical protein